MFLQREIETQTISQTSTQHSKIDSQCNHIFASAYDVGPSNPIHTRKFLLLSLAGPVSRDPFVSVSLLIKLNQRRSLCWSGDGLGNCQKRYQAQKEGNSSSIHHPDCHFSEQRAVRQQSSSTKMENLEGFERHQYWELMLDKKAKKTKEQEEEEEWRCRKRRMLHLKKHGDKIRNSKQKDGGKDAPHRFKAKEKGREYLTILSERPLNPSFSRYACNRLPQQRLHQYRQERRILQRWERQFSFYTWEETR